MGMMMNRLLSAARQSLQPTRGFTRAELVAVIAIGAVLTGLALAEVAQDKTKAQQEACANNLKQWGTVVQMYAHDFNGAVMVYMSNQTNYNRNWYSTRGVYAKYWSTNRVVNAESEAAMIKARICPAAGVTNAPTERTIPSYSMVRPEPATADFRGFNMKEVRKLSELMLMADSIPTNSQAYLGGNGGGVGDILAATNRHSGGVNLLFCDGHVAWKSGSDVSSNFTGLTSYSP